MKRIKKRFSRGVAKFVREEKARIRHVVQDQAEQERQIKTLYEHFSLVRKV